MTAWINEFHYDNTGADIGEFVEVILSGTETLSDYSLVLYNGSNGQPYDTDLLSTGTVTDLGNGYRSVVISYPGTLQNGAPDAIALVGPGGSVVEFVGYEGAVTATNGPANGMTSTNVGVAEPGNADGTSISRVGEGAKAADFTWSLATDDTPGGVNVGQVLKTAANTPLVSVVAADGTGVESVDPGFSFTFTRSGDLSQSLTVAYTVSGTAMAGVDYTPAPAGTVTFAAGSATATLELAALDDDAIEARETVRVALTDGAAYDLGAPSSATAGIVSDDGAPLKIHDVQGAGAASTRIGQTVVLEAIVTGDFQTGDADTTRNLNGFFIQEEAADWDDNALTSEGLFVFGAAPDVNVGDKVRITGTVSEFSGSTQVTAIKVELVQANAVADVSALAVDLAVPGDLEAYEGMMVRVPQTLVVHDQGDLERLGELHLYASEGDCLSGAIDEMADGRPFTYTQTNEPSVTGFAAHEAAVDARTVIYDDGLNGTWQGVQNPNGGGAYTTATAPNAGDTITGLTGVLDYGFGAFRIRSTENGQNTFTDANPAETAPPPVGGELTVASFNVLNFFVTLDDGSRVDNGQEPRGANTEAEFARQAAKLIGTLITLDADVLALVEIENDFSKPSDPAFLTAGPATRAEMYRAEGNAVGYLVEKLNEALGDDIYGWVEPGLTHVGTDAISTAFIYKKDVVEIAEGTSVAIDLNAVNDRPTLAVTFQEVVGGGEFTAVANHFKSKGSGTGANADQLDGQARSNVDRVAQAQRLDAWLDGNPTGTEDADVVLLGDFNAYFREDPIDVLRAAGYQPTFDEQTSSYAFDGQYGTLDYAFVNASMADQVTGAQHWHVGADFADALDYNLDGASSTYVRNPAYFDAGSPVRVSDHDITLIGLTLTRPNTAPVAKADAAAVLEDQSVVIDVLANDADADIRDTKTLVSVSPTASGATVAIVDGKLVYTADADAFDQLAPGAQATDTLTYVMKDAAGETSTATVTVTVTERGDAAGLNGGNGNETLAGTDKDETGDAGNGNDSMSGGAGADSLNGGNGNDTLAGGEGRDTLQGENGNDALTGGAGDDRLYGGLGNDRLTGGDGEDVFIYAKSEGNDVILDFQVGVDSLQFATGTEVRSVELKHIDGDGVLDAILTFGGGSLTIMGAGSADWIGA